MLETQLIWLQSEQQWRDIKTFYARQPEGGRPLRKERIAVLVDLQGRWLAAARLRSIGQRQLLIGVLVDELWRGQGIATALLQQLQSALAERDSYLFCAPALIELYQRQGFSLCERPAADIAQLLSRYLQHQQLVCMRRSSLAN